MTIRPTPFVSLGARTMEGHGFQVGQLCPDWGDNWAELKCDQCGATWTGPIGEACSWCQDALRRLRTDQAAHNKRNGIVTQLIADSEDEAQDDWAPIGLAEIAAAMRAGDYQQITPTVLAVEGSSPLLYPGRTNSLFGESGGGKTWIALAALAEVVRADGRCLFLDWEDTPAGTAERLVLLGLTDTEIALVDYRNPTTGLGLGIEYLGTHLDAGDYELVVLDSTGEAMASGAVNPNADEEVAMWFRRVKELTRLPGGPAVVVLDHVPKDKDAPASYAIGSQRKRAAVTGAAYRVDTLKEPAKGRDGKLRLTVAKDRPGNRAKGTTAAEVDVTSGEAGAITLRFHISDAQAAHDAGERWRPTIYMERVSQWLEFNPGATQRAIIDGCSGKRDVLIEALAVLTDEGWLEVTVGAHNARSHTLKRPYREVTDPKLTVDGSSCAPFPVRSPVAQGNGDVPVAHRSPPLTRGTDAGAHLEPQTPAEPDQLRTNETEPSDPDSPFV